MVLMEDFPYLEACAKLTKGILVLGLVIFYFFFLKKNFLLRLLEALFEDLSGIITGTGLNPYGLNQCS